MPSRVFSGERFKRLRKELGLKGSDIARGTGINQGTLSTWITGQNTPSLELLIVLADFMHLDLEDFLVPREEARDAA
jgi:transcriptional regulator with XRE-family HTH domain